MSFELMAEPVSPEKPADVPAMVVMMLVERLSLRMRWLWVSAM